MYEIDSYISSPESIPHALPSNLLGSVIEHTSSSHDSVFVFDEKNNFLGIVSPSFVLFKKRYPHTTKVQHCMISPPHLTKATPIYEVAQYMASTGAYSLPVFDDGEIIGVITARDVLQNVIDHPEELSEMKLFIKLDKPLLSSIHADVGEVYKILKKEERSRMILVDENGGIQGIVTRRDIQEALMPPTRKLRFRKNRGNGTLGRTYAFEDEKIKRFDYNLTEIYNPHVVIAAEKTDIRNLIQKMLSEKVNSIVLVDFENKPKKIISMRCVLDAISQLKPEEMAQIELSDRHNYLSEQEKERVVEIITRYASKLRKSRPIRNITVDVDGYKNSIGKITNYDINMGILLDDGESIPAQTQDKRILTAVRVAIRKIGNQMD